MKFTFNSSFKKAFLKFMRFIVLEVINAVGNIHKITNVAYDDIITLTLNIKKPFYLFTSVCQTLIYVIVVDLI